MGKKRLCEPCSSEGSQVQATHFCETCDDPEPLCDTCAKNHNKQKLSKYHTLSKNMQDFKNRYSKVYYIFTLMIFLKNEKTVEIKNVIYFFLKI